MSNFVLRLLFLTLCFAPLARSAETNDVRVWLTNSFRPWLTRYYPEVTGKFYPEWLHDHPAGLNPAPFTNWLTEVFPDLETESYPTWFENVAPEALGTNVPAWWAGVLQGKYTVSPTAQPLPTIVRGPYLQMGATNTMVVRWRTDLPTSNTVFLGTNLGRLNRAARASGTFTEHAVQFTNLHANTRYYYGLGPSDTPLLVHATNDLAFVTSTNSRIYVNKPETREQIAASTRDTFTLRAVQDRLVVSDLERSFTFQSTNRSLVVNTPNNAVLVTASNGTILVTTSNQISWLTPPEAGPARNFRVGTTNLIRVGWDTNTFFITHPHVGTRQPTRIWVLGDPGTRKKAERDVRDGYYKWTGRRHTDLWLMLGDNAYTSGKDSEYQGAVFQMFEAMLRKSVLWPCLGNHDVGSANSPIQFGVYFDIFTLPTLGQSGGVMSGTEAYYSFDYANIHFVCLDSSDSDFSTNGPMVKWLRADLAANQQDWLIAFSHHPPHSKGSHDSDRDRDSEGRMRWSREIFMPILEEHGLDLHLSGHSHTYERSYLLDSFYARSTNLNERLHFKSGKDGRQDGTGIYVKSSRGPKPNQGAVYVVAGSSGQTSGGNLQHPANALSLNSLGSMVLDVDGLRLDATFLDEKGQVRDYFTIQKTGE